MQRIYVQTKLGVTMKENVGTGLKYLADFFPKIIPNIPKYDFILSLMSFLIGFYCKILS